MPVKVVNVHTDRVKMGHKKERTPGLSQIDQDERKKLKEQRPG